jgi:hypothetical protein
VPLTPTDEPPVLAFAPADAVIATAEASAPNSKLPFVNSLSAPWFSKKTI